MMIFYSSFLDKTSLKEEFENIEELAEQSGGGKIFLLVQCYQPASCLSAGGNNRQGYC